MQTEAVVNLEQTHCLGRVFSDVTNSYKLAWFLGIVALLKQGCGNRIAAKDVLVEMAVAAWYPVMLYHLSLGSQDKLQETIVNIGERSTLKGNASPEEVRRFLKADPETSVTLAYLLKYVPTRFLTPWFSVELRGEKDHLKDARIRNLAERSQSSDHPSPYCFDRQAGSEQIVLNESWHGFLLENLGVVESFARFHFARYLQARNPNVPGVMNKLQPPGIRQLGPARAFWRRVESELVHRGYGIEFHDIYSGEQLDANFAVDHFLPWSFVAHDLLWNLVPVGQSTNSSKSDVLPDMNTYLPRMVRLQWQAINCMKEYPRMLEDYTNCFKRDVAQLVTMREEELFLEYRAIMLPQVQMAENLGFRVNWHAR